MNSTLGNGHRERTCPCTTEAPAAHPAPRSAASYASAGGPQPASCCVSAAQIQVNYLPGSPQSRTLRALDARPAARYTFKLDSRTMTVEQYFQQTYGISLAHADDWPCVLVSKTAAIPLELCT